MGRDLSADLVKWWGEYGQCNSDSCLAGTWQHASMAHHHDTQHRAWFFRTLDTAGTALNVNVLRLQQLLVKPADSKDFAADIELYGSLCSLLDVLERLYKFSAQLQMRLVSEPVSDRALARLSHMQLCVCAHTQAYLQTQARMCY